MKRAGLAFVVLGMLASSCGTETPTGESTAALTGMNWPSGQQFPSFAPVATLDVFRSNNRAADVMSMIVTLQGTVNRTLPRIYVSGGSASDNLWLSELGVASQEVGDPFALVGKYRGELAGVVITDDAQPDTLDLATTIAGLQNGIVASPALAEALTAAPYSLPVLADLRSNHFQSNLAVYQYELDHYAAQANHRLIIGLTPGIPGNLRDYAVATRAMTVWLDPRNAAEKALLGKFLALLPLNSPYLGWWLSEGDGVKFAATYGVPVYAADWSANLTVLGGAPRGSTPPPAPAPPPLENKVYVAVFMSDGDNLQEDEGLIPLKWADGGRGQVPIGWTINPALVDVAPGILRYFQRTATENDVLVSGPSGLGYTYPTAWPAGKFDSYTKVSGQYLAAAGLRVVTLWNNGVDLSDADASSYARNAEGLIGMTIQDGSQRQRMIDGHLPLETMALSYGDTEQIIEGGIDNELKNYNRTAPIFLAVQGNMNDGRMNPSALARVQARYAANTNIVFVRADHIFQLIERAAHPPAHKLFDGDFNGDRKSDSLFYYANGDWWMGLSDGNNLNWHNAGNVAGFGSLLDGRHDLRTGDFNGDGKTDGLFYFSGDGNWWVGLSDGNRLSWHVAANASGFGGMMDGNHLVSVGDYNGDGKSDLLFYYAGDGNWWLGLSDGNSFQWRGAGNTSGLGNLLDGSHVFYEGDFDGDGMTDLLFNYNGNGDWWLGHSYSAGFTWSRVDNTQGFGNLEDRSHRVLTGDFNGDRKSDLLFHYDGDHNWWMGLSTGSGFAWHLAATTNQLGELLDWSHQIAIVDADGDGKSDVSIYDSFSGDWTIGHSDGNGLDFRLESNTRGFGDLADASRRLVFGDYDGDGKREPLFYYNGDGNWWMSRSDGNSLSWHFAGNTAGFGDLLH